MAVLGTVTEDWSSGTVDTSKWNGANNGSIVSGQYRLSDSTLSYRSLGTDGHDASNSSFFAKVTTALNGASAYSAVLYIGVSGSILTQGVRMARTLAGKLQCFVSNGTNPSTATVDITYDPVAHAYWRVRFSGATVFFEVATEVNAAAGTWTILNVGGTSSTFTKTTVAASFELASTGGPGTMDIDNVNTIGAASQGTSAYSQGFEADTGGFISSSGAPTLARSTTKFHTGVASLQMTSTAASVTAAAMYAQSPLQSVQPSTAYTATMRMACGATARGMNIVVEQQDAAGNYIAASGSIFSPAVSPAANTANGAFSLATVSFTTQPNTAKLYLYAYVDAPTAVGQQFFADDVLLTTTASAGGGTPAPAPAPLAGDKWVTLYYPAYSQQTNDLTTINWNALTHLAHFGCFPGANGTLNFTNNGSSGADSMTQAKREAAVAAAEAQGKGILLTLGGIGPMSGGFRSATNSTNRTAFVNAIVAEVNARRYTGVDIDWEDYYANGVLQTNPGTNQVDQDQYVAFVQALRTALPASKTITATIYGSWVTLAQRVAPHVTKVAMMTYIGAYSSSGENRARHQSAIGEASPTWTWYGIDRSVTAWREGAAAVPASKVQIGMSRYGWRYPGATTLNGTTTTINESQGVGDVELAYSLITALGTTGKTFDPVAQAPYWVQASPQRVWTAEDQQSVTAKATYIADKGLGGIIIWEHHIGLSGASDPVGGFVQTAFSSVITGGGSAPAQVGYLNDPFDDYTDAVVWAAPNSDLLVPTMSPANSAGAQLWEVQWNSTNTLRVLRDSLDAVGDKYLAYGDTAGNKLVQLTGAAVPVAGPVDLRVWIRRQASSADPTGDARIRWGIQSWDNHYDLLLRNTATGGEGFTVRKRVTGGGYTIIGTGDAVAAFGVTVKWQVLHENGIIVVLRNDVRVGSFSAAVQSGRVGFVADGHAGRLYSWLTAIPATAPVPPATKLAPTAPQNVQVSFVGAGVQVSWQAPASAGTAPATITGYIVTGPGGLFASLSSTTLTHTFPVAGDGLYSVTATNSDNLTGPAGSAAPSVSAPGAPQNVAATSSVGGGTVSWTAPVSNGGAPVLDYTLRITDATSTVFITGVTTLSRVLTSLQIGRDYTIGVAARNRAGTGSEATVPLRGGYVQRTKVNIGGTWMAKPAKVWNGTAWVEREVKAPGAVALARPSAPVASTNKTIAGSYTTPSTQLKLVWTAVTGPALNGTTLSGYRIGFISDDPKVTTKTFQTAVVASPANPYVFTGLVAGATYSIYIEAVATNGTVARTTLLAATDPAPVVNTIPTAPQNFRVGAPTGQADGLFKATFLWDAPAQVGSSPIIGYRLGWGSYIEQAVEVQTQDPNRRSWELTNFPANAATVVSIYARNAAGESVAATTTLTTPAPTVTNALPTRVLGVYATAWSDNPLDMNAIHANYNLIYPFVAHRNGTGGAIHWTYNPVTNIAARRAAGTKIILSTGGAGSGIIFTSQAMVDNFVNSVIALNSAWGGTQAAPMFDGLDFNTFEADAAPSVQWYTAIVNGLRAFFGAGFIITSPPAPWNQRDKDFCKAMLASGHMSYCAPQYYDGSQTGQSLSLPANISGTGPNSVTGWVNDVAAGDASKIVVGFGYHPGLPDYSTIAQIQQAWDIIEARHPTIRGAFLWSHVPERTSGWPFATQVGPDIKTPGPS